MVSDPTTDDYFRFTPDGSGLTILNVERFVSELLPLYFKHSNLSSFVRQLNTYGFSKVDHGDGPYIYAHPDFHRDYPARLALIQRKSSHVASNARVGGAAVGAAGHHPGAGSVTGSSYFDSDENPLILHPGVAGAKHQPSIEATDPSSLRDLKTIFSTMRKMDDRIGELTDHVNAARNQQLETHQTMGKLMDFLSVIYKEHKVATVVSDASKGATSSLGGGSVGPPIDVSEEAVRRAEKRQRLSHGDGSERTGQGLGSPPPVELLAPLAPEERSALATAPPGQPPVGPPRVRSTSPPKIMSASLPSPTVARNLQLPRAENIAPFIVTQASGGEANQAKARAAAPDGTLAPQVQSLARSTSLGAHVALAMPSDVREFALGELAGSTELQDQAIKGLQEEANASAAVQHAVGRPVTEADAEDFLWDFLEASQDMCQPYPNQLS